MNVAGYRSLEDQFKIYAGRINAAKNLFIDKDRLCYLLDGLYSQSIVLKNLQMDDVESKRCSVLLEQTNKAIHAVAERILGRRFSSEQMSEDVIESAIHGVPLQAWRGYEGSPDILQETPYGRELFECMNTTGVSEDRARQSVNRNIAQKIVEVKGKGIMSHPYLNFCLRCTGVVCTIGTICILNLYLRPTV